MFGIFKFPTDAPEIENALKNSVGDAVTIRTIKARNPLLFLEQLDDSWRPLLDRLVDVQTQAKLAVRDPNYLHPHVAEVDRSAVRWRRLRMRYELRARTIISRLRTVRLRAGAIWNGQLSDPAVIAHALRLTNVPALFAELAPFPGRCFLDHVGVNGASSLQQVRPEALAPHPDEAALFERLKSSYRGRRAGKATSGDPADLPKQFVFAALQVPLDTQVLLHGDKLSRHADYIALLGEVARHLPGDVRLLVKPHPQAPYREEYLRSELGSSVLIGGHFETRDLLERCRAVITINSSIGPDAFLFDKPVIALGRAPWIKPGLAVKADGAPEVADAIVNAAGFDRTLRQRFLAHWYHSYTFATGGDETALPAFIEGKVAAAREGMVRRVDTIEPSSVEHRL